MVDFQPALGSGVLEIALAFKGGSSAGNTFRDLGRDNADVGQFKAILAADGNTDGAPRMRVRRSQPPPAGASR
jgi:hypothetical protein